LELFKFKNLSLEKDIEHFITTKKGGFSKPPFEFNNMSLENSDTRTVENRKKLAKELNLNLENFVYQYQTHTDNITIIDQSHKGKGIIDINDAIQENDALITNKRKICLVVMAGDCVPILLYDRNLKIIAAIHAGWKGTVKKIPSKAVELLFEKYNSKPQDIIVGIGPSIGKCCYEIGDEVKKQIESNFQYSNKLLKFNPERQKYHFDLWLANKLQLVEIGISDENIEIAEICTKCNQNTYYSARTGDLGRFSAGIFIK